MLQQLYDSRTSIGTLLAMLVITLAGITGGVAAAETTTVTTTTTDTAVTSPYTVTNASNASSVYVSAENGVLDTVTVEYLNESTGTYSEVATHENVSFPTDSTEIHEFNVSAYNASEYRVSWTGNASVFTVGYETDDDGGVAAGGSSSSGGVIPVVLVGGGVVVLAALALRD